MFVEEDLEATAMMVGGSGEPIILDRLQAQLHALASDPDTFLQDPHPSDQSQEEWTQWLADMDLDRWVVNHSWVEKVVACTITMFHSNGCFFNYLFL